MKIHDLDEVDLLIIMYSLIRSAIEENMYLES